MKQIIIGLIFVCFFHTTNGQGIKRLVFEDKLVSSLNNVLYIVKQEYSLRGPGNKLYGKNNNAFYGYAFGPAIAVNKELIFSTFTYKPYMDDDSFKSFGKDYTPEPTKSEIRKISGNKFITLSSKNTREIGECLFWSFADSGSISHTYIPNSKQNYKYCFVIFRTDDREINGSSEFRINYYNGNLERNEQGDYDFVDITFSPQDKFGYAFSEYTENGLAAFIFEGFIEKGIDNKWRYVECSGLNPIKKTRNK
jgi:hypothetical protein